MAKRLLDCTARELAAYSKDEKIAAIGGSEGRVIACESIGTVTPMLGNISNVEFLASLGADILLLNIFDVNNPVVQGLPEVAPCDVVREIKRLTGRLVAINLEPISPDYKPEDEKNMWKITGGRVATVDNAVKAADMGVDMILLTGNPDTGVTNAGILHSIRELKEAVGNRMIIAAGKMHASGILSEAGENIVTKDDVTSFIDAGADIVLFPAPGTVGGLTMDYIRSLVVAAHEKNALTMTAIGTSQEGSEVETIREIALMCKMAGVDIHHLGDSAFTGMAMPENVLAYSKTIRGARHTYRRMALSIMR